MGKVRVVGIFLLVIFILSLGVPVWAELKKADLGKRVTITEEAALLSQIDMVSLYLSSDRVVLAPRLKDDKTIEVETTVLAADLITDRERLRDFVSRQISTFIEVLGERLPVYAPAVAKSFDANTDIAFVINAGTNRAPTANWRAGTWQWENGGAIPQPVVPSATKASADINKARAMDAGRKGCRCPARINP